MPALTNYLENALINHLLRNTAYPAPASVQVALFTTNPTETGAAGTEVTGGSYARQVVSTTGGWAATDGSNGLSSNLADITFPTATANWGTVAFVGIYDSSGTNMLFHGALTASKTVNSGDTFRFPAGTLQVSLD